MDIYLAIRLKALLAVMRPGKEYRLRKIIRWYSKTFHTPIKVVEELPLEEVLQAYWEEEYQEMTEDERRAEREDLLLEDEERYRLMMAEELEEAESFVYAKLLQLEENKKKEEEAKAKLEATQKKDPMVPPIAQQPPVVPSELPKTLPPGITMTFVDDASFEEELDGFGTMKQPEKP